MNEKMIERKVRARLFFLKCSGQDETYDFRSEGDIIPIETPYSDPGIEEMNKRVYEAYKNTEEAASAAIQNGYWHLSGSKIKVFIKRAMRKLLRIFWGWYVIPIFERQSYFNGKILESVSMSVKTDSDQNAIMAELSKKVEELSCKLEKIDGNREELSKKVEELSCKLEKIDGNREELSYKLENTVSEQKKLLQVYNDIVNAPFSIRYYQKLMSYMAEKLNISYDPELIDSDLIDYFEFENWFRGTREEIKDRQEQYIKYLQTEYQDGYVIDLGCGRGELLELMKKNGIAARGVDCYRPFVKFNTDRGFDVQMGDALTVLSGLEDNSLNGIAMCQIAEHINLDYLCQLIRTGYKKLREGCCFIIETPNPQTLATYCNFYVDGSHIKPVHYDMLQHFFIMNHYRDVIRLADEYSEHPYYRRVQLSLVDKCDDEDRKKIIADINDLMFKGLDYSIVARK